MERRKTQAEPASTITNTSSSQGFAVFHNLTGTWWWLPSDYGASEPRGPYTTKEEAITTNEEAIRQ